ncbi:hypothetical protein [Streptosporangium lutulentum]|uniref:hypothetical protein n=1 Tax=Streptosporangium lutulentum TaxID=1461250 RepID=UPI0027D7E7DB|nr:hypothetical protein [Streptosporangium lutulentum]
MGTGVLLLGGPSAVYADGPPGSGSFPLDLTTGSSAGARWQPSGDMVRFRVRVEGPGTDARLAVVTTPAGALRGIECPDATGSRVPLPEGLQVCRVGDVGQGKSVDVLLDMPENTQDVTLTAVTRMRAPGGEMVTRKAESTVRSQAAVPETEAGEQAGEEARSDMLNPGPGVVPRLPGVFDAPNGLGAFGMRETAPKMPELSEAETADILKAPESSTEGLVTADGTSAADGTGAEGGAGVADDTSAADAEKAALAAIVEVLDRSFPPANAPVEAGAPAAESRTPSAPAEAVAPLGTPADETAGVPVGPRAQTVPSDPRAEAAQGGPQAGESAPVLGPPAPQGTAPRPEGGPGVLPRPEAAPGAGQLAPKPPVSADFGSMAPGAAPDPKAGLPGGAGQGGSGGAKGHPPMLRKPGMTGGGVKGPAAGRQMPMPQMPQMPMPQMPMPPMAGPQMAPPQMIVPQMVGPQMAPPAGLMGPMGPMPPAGQGMAPNPMNGSAMQLPPAMPSPASVMSQPLGTTADAQLQGAPLPRDVDGPNTDITPAAQSSSLLTGMRGLPAVGIAMAALLGLLWLQMKIRRRRAARPVL